MTATVNMEDAVGRQTINHFLYTFLRDYDTEKAADRTMRSKYVPHNLKTQLVSAMARCDAGDRSRIERVARFGMYIDNSCNELVYYNTVVTVVVRWTLSMYVDSAEVKRVFEAIMEDVGRVCDDDIQFVMEKYRYLEERNARSGSAAFSAACEETGLAGLLKAKRYSPEISLIRYYGQSVWLKILRALLRNSVKAFRAESFGSVFAGIFATGDDQDDTTTTTAVAATDGLDDESKALYKEFRDNRREWLKTMSRANSEKLERVNSGNGGGVNGGGVPPEAPPKVSFTAFDVQFDDEDDYDDDSYSDSDVSVAETVVEATRPRPSVASPWSPETSGLSLTATDGNAAAAAAYIATEVTREKQMRILSDDLRDVLVRERTSRAALSSRIDRTSGRDLFAAVETVNDNIRWLRSEPNNGCDAHGVAVRKSNRKSERATDALSALPYLQIPALPLPASPRPLSLPPPPPPQQQPPLPPPPSQPIVTELDSPP